MNTDDLDMRNILAFRQITGRRTASHRGSGGSRHVGRLRIAAAEILSRELGFTVDPSDIRPATGAWRTDTSLDVYSWELFTTTATGVPFVAGCWFTLTDFVKEAKHAGCYIDDGEIIPGKRP